MRLDRGEMGGTGIALLLHAGLVVALTMSLASVPPKPEPPAMEVEFVDSGEVALTAAAPSAASPPAAQAPAPVQPLAEPEPAAPTPAPIVQPAPAPRITPAPAPPRAQPSRPAPSRAAPPRTSRLGDDFLKGIADSPSPSRANPAPSAATFSAEAKASVDQAIKRQIQPCANRQPALGEGAERIRVVVNLRLERSGRLARPPSVVRVSGVDGDNERYEQPVIDQAMAVYRACSPLRLPAELYSTPQGGWGNINMTYRVP